MRGFSLVELLIAISIVTILAGMGSVLSSSTRDQTALSQAVSVLAQTIRRAELLARASDGDSAWGVTLTSNSIVLFKGTTYAGRDSAYDETFDMPSSIVISGQSEVVFSKFYGVPLQAGTTTLSLNASSTRSIYINAHGVITY